jgi:curli biogenesis system outer membrane secretion channel CsgG
MNITCHAKPTATSRAAHRAIPAMLAVLAILACLGAVTPVWAAAPDAAMLAEFRRDPMSFFFDLRSADAVLCGQAVLQGTTDFSPSEKKEALTTLAATYLAAGKEPQARAAVMQVLAIDPKADLSKQETLPPPLVQLFYGLRDSLLLASGQPGAPEILTLAIGDIENNSIVKGKYDMDNFARGLTHIITTDLKQASPFKLVDRQRLAALRQEIDMSRSDQVTDPRYGVPLGRLSGAQSFLFGSLMQVEGNKVRLDIRWVNTSTSEILLSEGLEAKVSSSDDLFKLERKLLLDTLAPRMQAWLSGQGQAPESGQKIQDRARPLLDDRKKNEGGGTAYLDFLLRSGEAMLAEEKGDYAAATTAWKQAAKLQPGDTLAVDRSRALDAQLAMAQIGQD